MSKIGRVPVEIPSGVKININEEDKEIKVSGPKGEVVVPLVENTKVEISDNQAMVSNKKDSLENAGAYWGLMRSLFNNSVIGVSEGFVKELELVGVGYRVEKTGSGIRLAVGYSHPVDIEAPQGITFDVENNGVKVSGPDKQVVGQIAANIRAVRAPEPYKGKGIKYKDEIVKRKQGKAAKAATS